jgi:hypothetical protein
MPKHKKSASDDDALRAFYDAFGLRPNTIEGAIRQRYEQPTNFAGWERAGEAARIARARKRKASRQLTDQTEGPAC